MIRSFILRNAVGKTVDLKTKKLFGSSPSGLGISFSNKYSQYGTSFLPTSSMVEQGSLTMSIVFGEIYSDVYETFDDFTHFLAYQPMVLEYETDSGKWYRDAVLSKLSKSEIGKLDRLIESFDIDFINAWYNNKSGIYRSYAPEPKLATYGKGYVNTNGDNAIPDDNDIVGLAIVGKAIIGSVTDLKETKDSYGYYGNGKYYAYSESIPNGNEKFVELENNSEYYNMESGSPSIITIKGPCNVQPSWSIISKGNIVATDKFMLTLKNNQELIISSYPENQYARVINPDGSYSDVSQLQDYTKTNFVQIPIGQSTILFYVEKSTQVDIVFKEERLLV